MQLIAQHFGGSVIPATSHEYGKAKLDIIVENEILKIHKMVKSFG